MTKALLRVCESGPGLPTTFQPSNTLFLGVRGGWGGVGVAVIYDSIRDNDIDSSDRYNKSAIF